MKMHKRPSEVWLIAGSIIELCCSTLTMTVLWLVPWADLPALPSTIGIVLVAVYIWRAWVTMDRIGKLLEGDDHGPDR